MSGDVPKRDQDAVLRFIERFASELADAGTPRMPARILGALLSTDSGSLTAAEVADLLQVSPAAVSGAVRYLTMLRLVTREREPGSRRDVYRIRDGVWYEAATDRDKVFIRMAEALREGVGAVGAETPAGLRLVETIDFFEYLAKELPAIIERWRASRA